MKLISTPTYDIYLEDQDINCINKFTQTYSRVFRVVAFRLQYLEGKKQVEIQQLQDIGFQTPAHQSKIELLYSDLSKPLQYKYCRYQSQKNAIIDFTANTTSSVFRFINFSEVVFYITRRTKSRVNLYGIEFNTYIGISIGPATINQPLVQFLRFGNT